MCGIFGIFNYNIEKGDIFNELIEGMKLIQHRGKDSYGLSFYNKEKDIIEYQKYLGPIKEFKKLNDSNKNEINNCIGHIRYSTSGNSINKVLTQEIQPLIKNNISIVHNGNIPNIKEHDTKYISKITLLMNH